MSDRQDWESVVNIPAMIMYGTSCVIFIWYEKKNPVFLWSVFFYCERIEYSAFVYPVSDLSIKFHNWSDKSRSLNLAKAFDFDRQFSLLNFCPWQIFFSFSYMFFFYIKRILNLVHLANIDIEIETPTCYVIAIMFYFINLTLSSKVGKSQEFSGIGCLKIFFQ